MTILKDLTDEELLDELLYIVESVPNIEEKKFYQELKLEVLSRMKKPKP